MKHRNRVLLIVSLLLPITSIAGGALVLGSVDFSHEGGPFGATRTELDEVLERVKDAARESATIDAFGDRSEREYRESQRRLQKIGREKRAVRLKIAALLQAVGSVGNQGDELLLRRERAAHTFDRQEENFLLFLRSAHAREVTDASGPSAGGWILRRLRGFSLGESIEADIRDQAIKTARGRILQEILIARESDALLREQLHAAAGDMGDQLFALREEHQELRKQYNEVLRALDRAGRELRASEEQMRQIQREQEQVQADLISIQSELDRIDGRLRSKVERELVQKGLLEDSPDRFKQNMLIGKGDFTWPASGPVSAGFQDAAYFRYFGFAHTGIDIVVPSGSRVATAADGIVFTVRLGGVKGYTYVLIGHRSGYATVYGHLLNVQVSPGQHVNQGEVIGVSGGHPGSEGAGPMTTGAHLHFEVTLKGVHVDPRTVLP